MQHTVLLLSCAASAVACIQAEPSEQDRDEPGVLSESVTVTVNRSRLLATVGQYAFGMHTSVYDNALHAEQLPEQLAEAGITMLRYPGGGYSDNYHWSVHGMTPWREDDRGYLADRSDFGSYVSVLERCGAAAMITVNYGSNLAFDRDGNLVQDGPGEPQEAAAWVAYANGDPDDDTLIGEGRSGNDWRSVGHWASLRAAEPVQPDDGQNFLRIAHPEPLGIEYWEVGNEVFGNGYYEDYEFELDLHVPYGDTVRQGHEQLSPTTYGREVTEYVRVMKAVDPSIQVGAVLNTPPMDYAWGPEWNSEVLAECGQVIDFAIVHWYTGNNPASLLQSPRTHVSDMVQELSRAFAEYGGDNAGSIELAMTELGPGTGFRASPDRTQSVGLFAADVYVTLMEHGFVNIDWLELHNGSFLSERREQLGPAYKGIQMAHYLVSPGDTLVRARSDKEYLLVAHAAERADGSVGIMLVNTDPSVTAVVTAEIDGPAVATEGSAYYYRPEGEGADGTVTGPQALSDLGGSFTIEVPPYSVTDVIVPSPGGA